jgi:dsRNA-specific ribonuclease
VQVLGEGEGRSLKKAEQRAAAAALRNAGLGDGS